MGTIPSKEILRAFREPRFSTSTEVEEFVADVGALEITDAQALFAVLLDRRGMSDLKAHRFRCALFRRLMANSTHLRELFVPMLRSVKQADPDVRQTMLEVLPLINSVGGHREVVALFRHPEPDVRQFGKGLAERIGGKTMFGLLVELCGSPDFYGRIEAMEACVTMAGYHAIPALRNALKAGTAHEKLRALEMLGDHEIITKNRDGALEAIASALDDLSEDVVTHAITSFGAIGAEEDFFRYVAPKLEGGSLAVVRATIRAMSRYRSQRVLDLLRDQIGVGPKAIRLAVLDVLEAMRHEDVLPVIAESLNHRQIEVRIRAAKALENLAAGGTIDVARTIIWLLRSRDVDVKRLAADLARRIGDPEGKLWPQLFTFLRDEDWWVRERITDALIDLAGLQLTRHVVGLLNEESPVVRRYAVEMLKRLQDPAALGALVRTVQTDADWWVRERAIEAMGDLGDARAVPYIVDFMQKDPELEPVCLDTLARIGDSRAAPHVAALIDPQDVDRTTEVLTALEAIGDRTYVSVVMPLTDHINHELRQKARGLIRRWNLDAQFAEWSDEGSSRLGTLDRLLWATAKANGDDLLLAAGRQPYIKRLGEVAPLVKNVFTNEQIKGLLYPHLTETQIGMFEQAHADVDFSYEVKSAGLRFRVNVLQEANGIAAVFRVVRNVIPAMEELGMPSIVNGFGDLKNGLVLVGGPTGAGKSTTLAAIIDYINRSYRKHIITLEDPIEVIHTPKQSLVNQREMGTHSADFRSALRSTLREDPDVILVGEMRDPETIGFAITAAETGHLVFGTVHTTTADTSVDRIINAFPHGQQPQVRTILASSLRAVLCQLLVPRRDGRGRVPSVEVMLNSDAVSNLIRKGKTFQIPNVISMSRESGMQSMDNDLIRLYKHRVITADDGYMRANNKKEFEAAVVEHDTGASRAIQAISGDHKIVSLGDEG
ncbi:MAG: PilT/PilU family type 4a pilus ATPase [Myxococcales bacterium]|nr:PilT/PilU family type 4a pilus ATPase [Myxococcales bacterium]MCB9519704.1 PilT/PilU family type 4a pilus ATPase [Myxococcales bacterium]MCB9530395.1 PilT/PilU family type 4a pilus ATPase [Myxococcales bacterium]MCB9533642.1 PilT/PilU family type 4a pilus ATPase [Myxococcales bacterium]